MISALTASRVSPPHAAMARTYLHLTRCGCQRLGARGPGAARSPACKLYQCIRGFLRFAATGRGVVRWAAKHVNYFYE
jgi:hypothetical protein